MFGSQFKNFICFTQILLGQHGLIETMVTYEPLARICFIPKRRVNIRLNGAVLVGIQLLLDPETKKKLCIPNRFFCRNDDKLTVALW